MCNEGHRQTWNLEFLDELITDITFSNVRLDKDSKRDMACREFWMELRKGYGYLDYFIS